MSRFGDTRAARGGGDDGAPYGAGVITPGRVDPPPEFRAALESLRAARLRPEVRLEEVPAPTRIAPWAVALSGEVVGDGDAELATGRFVVLHDPAGQEAWRGTFRVVTLVRATLEPEMADDPLLADVAWSWVEESLDAVARRPLALGGTVTRVLSQSYGALAGTPNDVDLEVRASWTPPATDVGTDLAAWAGLLATAVGLPPLPAGVTVLPVRRNTVGS